jgi:hypothetical protein
MTLVDFGSSFCARSSASSAAVCSPRLESAKPRLLCASAWSGLSLTAALERAHGAARIAQSSSVAPSPVWRRAAIWRWPRRAGENAWPLRPACLGAQLVAEFRFASAELGVTGRGGWNDACASS